MSEETKGDLRESVAEARNLVRDWLSEITDESPAELKQASDSVDLSLKEEWKVNVGRERDETYHHSGRKRRSQVRVRGGEGGSGEGGAVARPGGGSSGIGPNSERTGNRHECRRCGRKKGLIDKYDIYLCRQCFRELARDMGFKKYR